MKTNPYPPPLARLLRHPILPKEEVFQLIDLAQAGDRAAHERIVLHHQRLILSVARPYIKLAKTMDVYDLMQEGNVALAKAIRRFDRSKHAQLATYARILIRFQIIAALYKKERLVRLSSDIESCLSAMRRTAISMVQELGREPTLNEIVDRLVLKDTNRDPESLRRMLKTLKRRHISLDAPLPGRTDRGTTEQTYGDVIPDDAAVAAADAAEISDELERKAKRIEEVAVLVRCSSAPEKWKEFFFIHFGLNGGEPEELASIARREGVSKQSVHQRMWKIWKRFGCRSSIPDPVAFRKEVADVSILRERACALCAA